MNEGRTMIAGVIGEAKDPAILITQDGTQYAKLPEGWPAAEDKDLEEAHAEAVASDEGVREHWEGQIRNIYATFTPEEVRELCEDWVRLVHEVTALRKGMKTMQRKQRKQAQEKRRLERRLSQARASRDRHRETASFYFKASLARGLEEAQAEPQASSAIDFDALSKEPRSFA